jgi:DNA-binding NarL/FixJ family response regulator
MTGPTRVLVADDQRVVREGLGTLLGLITGIEVVGSVADGNETTIKSHINHLFAKTGVRDRAQAVTYAYQHGLT